MTKSKEILESLDAEELQILLLCFSKPKVMEAMRIYNKIPGHGKKVFYEEGTKQMQKLGLLIPALNAELKTESIEQHAKPEP